MPIRRQYQPIGSIVADVTGARALGVVYQNITGQALLVIVTLACSSSIVINSAGQGNAFVENVTPPTVQVGRVGVYSPVANVPQYSFLCMTFVVPVGQYYAVSVVTAGGGTCTITYWSEVTLIAPFSAGF